LAFGIADDEQPTERLNKVPRGPLSKNQKNYTQKKSQENQSIKKFVSQQP